MTPHTTLTHPRTVFTTHQALSLWHRRHRAQHDAAVRRFRWAMFYALQTVRAARSPLVDGGHYYRLGAWGH